MDWKVFLTGSWGASLYFFAATVIILILLRFIKRDNGNNNRKQIFTPGKVFFVGVFVSAFAYFLPAYLQRGVTLFTAILNSIQHSFRIFALDGDFMEFVANAKGPADEIKELYVGYGAFLYALAPILTFGFILTFFKNFFAHVKYRMYFFLETHVFSELNEKSLALAESILENNKPFLGFIPKVLIVFTDIVDKKEELHLDLVEEAKGKGAILFRKDLESVHFKNDRSCRKLKFYIISEDESEKIRHAENIMKCYDDENVELWIFSDDIRTELMIAKNEVKKMAITRVNDIQSLIYHHLDANGNHLFERARETGGRDKVISAVIIGLGKYGQEMIKALAWYCQLEGYALKINAFDADEKAKEKFEELCPELLYYKYNTNKNPVEGEAHYEIKIHNGIDVSVSAFEQEFEKIKDATYIFVSLGEDEINLAMAARLRIMSQRIDYTGDGHKPDIETVIYDSNVRKKLGLSWEDVEEAGKKRKKKRDDYDILMIGDLERFYSEKTVIGSELVKAGLEEHKYWSVEPSRISLTEEYMKAEWEEFIKTEGLERFWTEFCAGQERKGAELAKAIEGFLCGIIEKIEQSGESKERILEKKNLAAQISHRWEGQVYAKFGELVKNPDFAKRWTRLREESEKEAAKSFRIEYNYRSSIAKAIHKRLRNKPGFKTSFTSQPWIKVGENEKSAEKRDIKMAEAIGRMSFEDRIENGKIEHIRWNAYMRTEGYRYASQRDDLARLHHNLVPLSELSNEDLRKDI